MYMYIYVNNNNNYANEVRMIEYSNNSRYFSKEPKLDGKFRDTH